jgi:hypothetical protein
LTCLPRCDGRGCPALGSMRTGASRAQPFSRGGDGLTDARQAWSRRAIQDQSASTPGRRTVLRCSPFPVRRAPRGPETWCSSTRGNRGRNAKKRAEADGNRTRQARLGASPVLKFGEGRVAGCCPVPSGAAQSRSATVFMPSCATLWRLMMSWMFATCLQARRASHRDFCTSREKPSSFAMGAPRWCFRSAGIPISVVGSQSKCGCLSEGGAGTRTWVVCSQSGRSHLSKRLGSRSERRRLARAGPVNRSSSTRSTSPESPARRPRPREPLRRGRRSRGNASPHLSPG